MTEIKKDTAWLGKWLLCRLMMKDGFTEMEVARIMGRWNDERNSR